MGRQKATESLKAAGQQEPSNKELTSKLAGIWKAANAEEKAPFEERYKKEQVAFLEKQKAWQATPEFREIEKAEEAQEEKRRAAEPQDIDDTMVKKRRRSSREEQPSPKGKQEQTTP